MTSNLYLPFKDPEKTIRLAFIIIEIKLMLATTFALNAWKDFQLS